jgi:hypothetical protein
MVSIYHSTLKLQRYIKENNYMGFDPYDTLLSPYFNLPILNSRFIRFGAQQVCKRIPFSLRKLLSIKKGLNPVTIGLSIQAYSYLANLSHENESYYKEEINYLIELLIQTKSEHYSGICWGYNFDWEARYTKINAYVPTSVATGIITNGLFESYLIYPNDRIKEIILDASKFIVNDLNRSKEGELFCFSYSPLDQQFVLNASLKAARLLSQAYFFNQDESLARLAHTAVKYVVNVQRGNGSWPYAVNDARSWADNYHTGYILDCLDAYMRLCEDFGFKKSFDRGLEFYVNNFFEKEMIPKFYDSKVYPIDSTSAAQSLLTLSRFGYLEKAEKIANWYISNMQDKSGGFYFRKHKWYKDRNIYMRWNNAWMLAGLSYFLFQKEKQSALHGLKI